MRECHQPGSSPGGVAEGVVHAFQCGEPMTNPMLSTIWARELSRAAQYTVPGYPPIRGLPALREATCASLARRRALHARPADVRIVGGTPPAVALLASQRLGSDNHLVADDPPYTSTATMLTCHAST